MGQNQPHPDRKIINPSVEKIKGTFSRAGSLLRPYNFKMNIPQPFLNVQDNVELNQIAQDTSLPSKTHGTQPVYYGGPLTQIPYITTYPGTISLTMMCPDTSQVRNKFYKWMDSVIDPGNGTVNYRNDYLAKQIDLQVTRSIETGILSSPPIKYTLFDVFPDSINEIQLTQNSQNDYVRMTVVLMFKKWVKNKDYADGKREELERTILRDAPGRFA